MRGKSSGAEEAEASIALEVVGEVRHWVLAEGIEIGIGIMVGHGEELEVGVEAGEVHPREDTINTIGLISLVCVQICEYTGSRLYSLLNLTTPQNTSILSHTLNEHCSKNFRLMGLADHLQ